MSAHAVACLLLLWGCSGLELHASLATSAAVAQSRLGQLHAASQWGNKHQGHSSEFDCTGRPFLCQAPFDCDKSKPDKKQIATDDGHPDFHAWCSTPYAEAAVHCQAGNLSGYATVIHKAQLNLMAGPISIGHTVENIDAHYCFAFGHCDNTEVTEQTTLAEMEHMCDEKFGHDEWTQMRFEGLVGPLDGRVGVHGVYLSKKAESKFAQMACAMGNYHCDTIYCKQEYCRNPDFTARFGSVALSKVMAGKKQRDDVKAKAVELKASRAERRLARKEKRDAQKQQVKASLM